MADANGQHDNLSRPVRIERAMEFVGDVQNRLSETGGKLDGLTGPLEHGHRSFHERLKRPEEKH